MTQALDTEAIREALVFTPEATAETGALLLEVAKTLRTYVMLNQSQLVACSLWVMHTWAIEAADATLYLRVHSPLPESGKTRLLETLHVLVRRPWSTGRTTTAALIRKVAAGATLLYDETDRAFASGEEFGAALLAVLNSGWRRGGTATVCVGQGAKIEAVDFSVFGPKAFAGLGTLPDTVVSRSAPIAMRRRVPEEPIEKFYWRQVTARKEALRDHLAAWAAWAAPALGGHQPDLPEALGDRQAESWEPLFAIADMAGGTWPDRARLAATVLHAKGEGDNSAALRLLEDIRRVFAEAGTDRVFTVELLEALRADEEAPWKTWGRKGDGLTPYTLARLLRPFEVESSGTVRIGDRTRKGYYVASFHDAFRRYLPASPSSETSDPSHASQAAPDAGIEPISEPSHEALVTVAKNDQTPRQTRSVTDVTDKNRPGEENSEEAKASWTR